MFQFKASARNLLLTAPIFFMCGFFNSKAIAANNFPSGAIGNKINAAFRQGQQENKKVIIYFSADWCSSCKKLQQALQDPEVKKILQKHFIVLNIDDKEDVGRVVENYYQVSGFPAMILLDKDGKLERSLSSQSYYDIYKADELSKELAVLVAGDSVVKPLLAAWPNVPHAKKAEAAYKIMRQYFLLQNETEVLSWLRIVEQYDLGVSKNIAAKANYEVASDYYSRKGDVKTEKIYLQRVLDYYPKCSSTPNAVLRLAILLFVEDRKNEVKALFEKGLAIDPGNLQFIQNYLDFCVQFQWDLERAFEVATEALKNSNATQGEYHVDYSIAALNAERGNCTEATNLYHQLLSKTKKPPTYTQYVENVLKECKKE